MRLLRNISYFIISCLISSASLADTVFLIQLGSYDSEEKAEKAWNELVSNNKSVLKDLTNLNSKISLPPDNIDVYRLQAGPIKNRIDAKAICAELGSDCFVVETAMFVGDKEFPTMIADDSSINDIESESEIASESANKTESESSSFSLLDDITDALTSPFSSSTKTSISTATSATEAISETDIEIAENKEEQAQESGNVILPWLRNKNKRHRVLTTFNTDSKENEAEVNKENQKEEEIAKEPAQLKDIANEEKPVTKTETAKEPEPVKRPIMKSEVIMQKLPGVKMATKKPAKIASPANKGKVEVAEAIAVPLSEITAATDNAIIEPVKTNSKSAVLKTNRKPLGLRSTPSQNFLQKSLWVKINYFDNEKSANNYWRELRNSHPETTKNLRRRITKPYSNRKIAKRVSMQLGPLLEYKDVQKLCEIAVTSPDLKCAVQRNNGVSTTSRDKRSINSDSKYYSRATVQNRYSGNKKRAHSTKFWTQMGSYRNRGDAMKVWSELKAKHKELKKLHPHLAHPAYSSSQRVIYRLRSGPFATRAGAQELCTSLNSNSTPCIVVNN